MRVITPRRCFPVRILCVALVLLIAPAAVASPLLAREVVVSEIAWMGTSTSSADVWIELYNNTSSPINLAGWTLRAADGTPGITLQGSIPAHGYYLLERADDTTVPAVAADRIYAGALDNTGKDLLLRDVAVALAKGCPVLKSNGQISVFETFNVM